MNNNLINSTEEESNPVSFSLMKPVQEFSPYEPLFSPPSYKPPIDAWNLLTATIRMESSIGTPFTNIKLINLGRDILDFMDDFSFNERQRYDAWPLIKGTKYEDYYNSFLSARTKDDVFWLMGEIDREENDRRTIENAGGMGTLLSQFTSVFDPPNWIGFGGVASKIGKMPSLGKRFFSSIALHGATGLASSALQEAVLSGQATRSPMETQMGIVSGTVLPMILGGAMSLLPVKDVPSLEDHVLNEIAGRANSELSQEIYKSGSYTRKQFRDDIITRWGLNEDQVDVALSNFENSIIKRWANDNGKTVDDWYTEHIGQVVGYDLDMGRQYLKGEIESPDELFSMLVDGNNKELFKGATNWNYREDGKAVIAGLKGAADLSTLLHEVAHIHRKLLPDEDIKVLNDWLGIQEGKWGREHEETYVQAVESFIRDGDFKKEIPEPVKPILTKFRDWLVDIYDKVKNNGKVEISEPVRTVLEKHWVPFAEEQRVKNPIPTIKDNYGEISYSKQENVVSINRLLTNGSPDYADKSIKNLIGKNGKSGGRIDIDLNAIDSDIPAENIVHVLTNNGFKKGEKGNYYFQSKLNKTELSRISKDELLKMVRDKGLSIIDKDIEKSKEKMISRLIEDENFTLYQPLFDDRGSNVIERMLEVISRRFEEFKASIKNPEDFNPEDLADIPGIPKGQQLLFKKMLFRYTPAGRIFTSASSKAKQLGERLFSFGFLLKKNQDGIPLSENIETNKLQTYNKYVNSTLFPMKEQYVNYRKRIADGSIPQELNFVEYNKIKAKDAVNAAGDYLLGERNQVDVLEENAFNQEVYKSWKGEKTDIPEAKAAAEQIKTAFKDMETELKAAGLLPPDYQKANYVPRIYDVQMILRYPEEFKKILRELISNSEIEKKKIADKKIAELKKKGKFKKPEEITGNEENMTAVIEKKVDDLYESITKSGLGMLWYDIKGISTKNADEFDVPEAMFLKEKTLQIDDNKLTGIAVTDKKNKTEIVNFIMVDPDRIVKRYLMNVVPDLELKKMFGSIDLKKEIEGVQADYKEMVDKAKAEGNDGRVTFLQKEEKAVLKNLLSIRDRIRNRDKVSSDPNGLFTRMTNSMLKLNMVTYLGNMLISSVPDAAKPVFRHGFKEYEKALHAYAKLPDSWIKNKNWLKKIGAGFDMVTGSRFNEYSELFDDSSALSLPERFINYLSDNYGIATVQDPWNSTWKQITGLMLSDELLNAAEKVGKNFESGKWKVEIDPVSKLEKFKGDFGIETRDVHTFAQMGLSVKDLKDVWGEFLKKGDSENPDLKLAVSHEWENQKLAHRFNSAILKEIDNIITQPGVADRPLFASTQLGRVFFQFRSFNYATMNRTIIPMMQTYDENMGRTFGAMLGAVFLGAIAVQAKELVRGRELISNPAELMKESIDNAGITGLLFDGFNLVNQASDGAIGIGTTRYRNKSLIDQVLGPSASTLNRGFQVAKAATGLPFKVVTGSDDWVSRNDINAAFRMIPYSTLFYWRWAFNWMNKTAQDLSMDY